MGEMRISNAQQRLIEAGNASLERVQAENNIMLAAILAAEDVTVAQNVRHKGNILTWDEPPEDEPDIAPSEDVIAKAVTSEARASEPEGPKPEGDSDGPGVSAPEAEKKAALQREEQAKQDLINAENQAEAEKEQAIENAKQAEVKRLADVEQARVNEVNRQAAELKAQQDAENERLANVEHVRVVNRAILDVLEENDISTSVAKKIVTLAAKGLLPNISINY